MIQSNFKKQYSVFSQEGLNPTEVCILTNIYNRYNLSQNNADFFDKEVNDYYVIYTNADLSKELNVSVSTIKREIHTLVKKSWIKIKRFQHRVNKIFIAADRKPETLENNVDEISNDNLSQLTETKKNPALGSNCSTRKTENKNTKKTYRYITDAENGEKSNQKQKFNPCKSTEQQSNLQTSKVEQEKLEQNFLNETMQYQGIPERVINAIRIWSNSISEQKEFKDTIFLAKKAAQDNAFNQGKDGSLTFEDKDFPTTDFENKFESMIVKAKKEAKNTKGYLYTSLRNYFENVISGRLKNDTLSNSQTKAKPIPLTKWYEEKASVAFC